MTDDPSEREIDQAAIDRLEKVGGHAFPGQFSVPSGLATYVLPGMTLRDYFAAQAIGALPDHLRELQTDHRIKIAEWAYGLADAMLAERTK